MAQFVPVQTGQAFEKPITVNTITKTKRSFFGGSTTVSQKTTAKPLGSIFGRLPLGRSKALNPGKTAGSAEGTVGANTGMGVLAGVGSALAGTRQSEDSAHHLRKMGDTINELKSEVGNANSRAKIADLEKELGKAKTTNRQLQGSAGRMADRLMRTAGNPQVRTSRDAALFDGKMRRMGAMRGKPPMPRFR